MELGVTTKMLEGKRFVRVLPRVYHHSDHEMTQDDWVAALALALPNRARLTGISRLQRLGLDFGPQFPIRFVVEGDPHFTMDKAFIHRTRRMPPTDDVGVTPEAAFLSYCRWARVVDAIKVGDWLLHQGHATKKSIADLAMAQLWRDGAPEALWILDHLNGDARSLKESETRAVLEFAGLAGAEVNLTMTLEDGLVVIGDLVFRQWGVVVEYEGQQHQEQRAQYVADIDRYALFRRNDLRYVQATKEKLNHARTLVGEVYRELVDRGYDGRPPEFGEQWRSLFARVTDVIGPRTERRSAG